MKDAWAISMLISGGLFAGGVLSIAWERLPAWRRAELPNFRIALRTYAAARRPAAARAR
jgi:hypothetical protein